MIDSTDEGWEHKISLLEAMTIADTAWKVVSSMTIQNCFKVCGFEKQWQEPWPDESLDRERDTSITDTQWNLLMPQNNDNPITFLDFVTVDEDVAEMEKFSDESILAEDDEEQDDEVQDDEGEPVRPVPFKQAKAGLKDLRIFSAAGEVGDNVFQALHTLEVVANNVGNDSFI